MAKKTISSHKVTPYVIIDFETSGFISKDMAITEIAMLAIKGDDLTEIGRYEALVAPYGEKVYDKEAGDKTGLTYAFLEKNGKDFKTVVEETKEFLKKANIYDSKTGYKPLIIGQNPLFEVACLQQMQVEGGLEIDKLLHGQFDYHGNYQPYYQDTITLAKYLWAANPKMTNYKLETICETAGIEIVDAHRAMNDVKPSTEFLIHIIKAIRGTATGSMAESTLENDSSFRKDFHFEF